MKTKEFRWRTKAIQFMNELKNKGYKPKLTYWNDSFGTTIYYVKWSEE